MTGRIVDSLCKHWDCKVICKKNHEIDGAAEAIDDFNLAGQELENFIFNGIFNVIQMQCLLLEQ